MDKEFRDFKKQVREAVANYMQSEGCSCCEDREHDNHKTALAKLLKIPKYPDGSGYDFSKYRSNAKK